eukprot:PhF_6_TR8293/c0_g3_i3/m.12760
MHDDKLRELQNEYCRVFESNDTDEDGKVSLEDIPKMVISLGIRLTQEEIQTQIAKVNHFQRDSFTLVDFFVLMTFCRAKETRGEHDDVRKAHIEALQPKNRILPDALLRWLVDAIALVVGMFYFFVISLEDVRPHWFSGEDNAWYAVESVLSALIICELCINAVSPPPGEFETVKTREIIFHYLTSWRFFVDIVSALPYHYLVPMANGVDDTTSPEFYVRTVIRHFRLLKIFRTPTFFEESESNPQHTAFAVFAKTFLFGKLKWACYLTMYMHILCVFWLYLKPNVDYFAAFYLVISTVLTIGLGNEAMQTTVLYL